jgi:ribonuclease J
MTLDRQGLRPAEVVDTGDIFVDGLGDVGSVVLRDRRHLGRNGFLVVVIGRDATTGEVILGPEILSRGFVHTAEAGELIAAAKELVGKLLQQEETAAEITGRVHASLLDFCQRRTGRRPMIIPLVVEI